MTNWAQATREPDVLALIILLVSEFIDLYGRRPTVQEIQERLEKPGL